MPLRTYVGFVADFPIKVDGQEPAGKELADFIAQGLVESGVAVDGFSVSLELLNEGIDNG